MKVICKNCKFSKLEHDGIYGTDYSCRVYPPIYIRDQTEVFPLVKSECWCGKFEKKLVDIPEESNNE